MADPRKVDALKGIKSSIVKMKKDVDVLAAELRAQGEEVVVTRERIADGHVELQADPARMKACCERYISGGGPLTEQDTDEARADVEYLRAHGQTALLDILSRPGMATESIRAFGGALGAMAERVHTGMTLRRAHDITNGVHVRGHLIQNMARVYNPITEEGCDEEEGVLRITGKDSFSGSE